MLPIHGKIKEKLDAFCESKKIPHLLFTGAPGTGKRTVLFDFLHKVYNNDKSNMKTNIMFVNCAHGKGIKFIREDIKFFAKTNIQLSRGVMFKSVVLLNADFLTIDAQSALRRCIEQFSVNTRFFIIVENKQKLLNPILSRFCEIYFPEYICPISGEILNLHKYHIQQKCGINENVLDISPFSLSSIQLQELVNELYENGYSGLDIEKWIQKNPDISDTLKTTMSMIFNKIRMEYRCEKLLMFYILDRLKNASLFNNIEEMNTVGFI